MVYLIILVAFIIFIAVIVAIFIKPAKREKYPYRKKDYLLSIAEKDFYAVLKRIAEENNYLLFSKVRLEDLLWIPKSVSQKERFGLRNRIKSRHVDFLICDRDKISPLLAIELDDSSHGSNKGMERDGFVNQALEDAQLPLLRFKAQRSYDSAAISEKIKNKLNKTQDK